MVSNQSCPHGLLIEFVIQAFGVVVEQGMRVFYLVVNLVFLYQVLVKRVEEVKVIVLVKIEPGKIARLKTNIRQLQDTFGGIGVRNEVGPLFNAIKRSSGSVVRARKAELANTTADIQDLNAGGGRQEIGSVLGHLQRCPMFAGQLADLPWIELVKALV